MIKQNPLIGSDTIPAIHTIENALRTDFSPIAPTACLREQVKRILVLMYQRRLFTWYEALGVKLLTIRKG